MRKKKPKFAIVFAVLFLAAAGFAGYEYMQIQDLNEANAGLTENINSNTKAVYVATRYIESGETIESDGAAANVQIQNIASGIDDAAYILDDQIGQVALVDIEAGYPIYVNMITETQLSPDTRDLELVEVVPMTTQKDYDVVDVRIKFPNGEDYLVLTNKTITNLNLASCAFNIHANEEEILRFQSACVDAYITGGMLYTTRYIEPVLQTQNPLEPDYLVRAATVDLISQTDTNTKYDNVVAATLNKQARRELAARLGMDTEDNLLNDEGIIDNSAVTEGYTAATELKKSVLENRSQMLDDISTEEPVVTEPEEQEEAVE